MAERILFLTGHLARPRLSELEQALAHRKRELMAHG